MEVTAHLRANWSESDVNGHDVGDEFMDFMTFVWSSLQSAGPLDPQSSFASTGPEGALNVFGTIEADGISTITQASFDRGDYTVNLAGSIVLDGVSGAFTAIFTSFAFELGAGVSVGFEDSPAIAGAFSGDGWVYGSSTDPFGGMSVEFGAGSSFGFFPVGFAWSGQLTVNSELIDTGLTPSISINTLAAGSGNDSLTGMSFGQLGYFDSLTGLAGNDTLSGGGGHDTLDGGAGKDVLKGGAHDDTYFVDLVRSGASTILQDTVTELANAGNDTLILRTVDGYTLGSAFNFVLTANVENLDFSDTGTFAFNATGNALANAITGNGGNNSLSGGTGNDTLAGGDGNDIYLLDKTEELAHVVELADGGIDTLRIGYANASTTIPVAIALAGGLSEFENLAIVGGGLFNLTGNAAGNVLTGNASANRIDGGAGADTMVGLAGNDVYVVDDLADKITDASGIDTVESGITWSIELSPTLENVTLTGDDAVNATGNALANVLTGNSDINVLIGLKGNDTYIVQNAGDVTVEALASGTDVVKTTVTYALGDNVENLILQPGAGDIGGTGNALVNTITGNTGNNTLDGGGARDVLAGGAGNDTYVVDLIRSGAASVVQDAITEAANAGNDTLALRTPDGYTLGSAYTALLPGNVENLDLSLTDALNINATGNAVANILIGNDGNNLLNGMAGSDSLEGGGGNDIFVWDPADAGIDGGAGIDTVRVDGKNLTLDFSDGDPISNVEVINITGTGNNTLTVDADAVLALSGDGVLRIDGNAGDVVNKGEGWTHGANQTIGANVYRTFTQGEATLLVDSDVLLPGPLNVPVGDAVPLTGDARIDGLVQGGAWTFPGDRIITYSLDLDDVTPRAWSAAMATAIDLAFDAWAAYINVDFQRVPSNGLMLASSADISVSLVYQPSSDAFQVAGIGVFPDPDVADQLLADNDYTRDEYPRPEGDIVFNLAAMMEATPGLPGRLLTVFSQIDPGEAGFAIMLHEIGHALGLKHPDDSGGNDRPTFAELGVPDLVQPQQTVMANGWYIFQNTPMLLDVFAAQQIYGANATAHAGDDTYRIKMPGNKAPGIDYASGATIWDTGGTDTLSAELMTYLHGALLDLREGGFSGINGGNNTNLVSVAFGSVIEHVIGSAFGDSLYGNNLANRMDGGAGNDSIFGGAGNDSVTAGDGNDVVSADSGDDTLLGGEGADTLSGGAGQDSVGGGGGADSLDGGDGADALAGDGGTDSIAGGEGADTITGGADADSIDGGSGNDWLRGEAGNDTLVGEVGNDLLEGGSGANSLLGGSGDDTLVGGDGNDSFVGGTGNDTYDQFNPASDTVVDDGGVDTVVSTATYALSDFSPIENITLSGSAANATGNNIGNVLVGNDLANVLSGGMGNDSLSGMGGNDSIDGGDYRDSVLGGAGNDTMTGGLRPDTLAGGTGNDVYLLGDRASEFTLYVHKPNGVTLIEASGGNLTVFASDGPDADSLVDQVSITGIDHNTPGLFDAGMVWFSTRGLDTPLLAGTYLDAERAPFQSSGHPGLSVSVGGTGFNEISGSFVINSIEFDYSGASPLLVSLDASFYQIGLEQNPALWTWTGTVLVSYADPAPNDSVVELENEGRDRVETPYSYVLPNNVEDLTLTGSASVSGTGNASGNSIVGNSGNNSLYGAAGNDTLVGGGGNDLFRPGLDSDSVDGGAGIDTFDVSDASAAWTVNLRAAGQSASDGATGEDTVTSIENVIGGSGNDSIYGGDANNSLAGGEGNNSILGDAGHDSMTGGSGHDTLEGGDGVDLLTGGDGNDSMSGGIDADTLLGQLGNDSMSGGGGADSIDGGAGNDSMSGGEGDDTYVVDSVGDQISEADGSGFDTVVTGFNWTLSEEFEGLRALPGTGDWVGTGNTSANVITGAGGNDLLSGGEGNDTLDGGTGADTLYGGNGDDTYVVDSLFDEIEESGDGGVDTVVTWINWTLEDGFEVLKAGTGIWGRKLNGNALNNSLLGSAGDDTIAGGIGNDTVDGGLGNDAFGVDAGSDSISGGEGIDVLEYRDSVDPVFVDLRNGAQLAYGGGAVGVDTVSSIEIVAGGLGNDTLHGGDAVNWISGLEGNDSISGGDGSDNLTGDVGDDWLGGDSGADTLWGGAGADTMVGGAGNDSAWGYTGNDSFDGGDGADTLDGSWGGSGDNTMSGGDGNDRLIARNGADSLYGGAGNDSLESGAGNDTLQGGDGADTLNGGDGNDFYDLFDPSSDLVIEGYGVDTAIVVSNYALLSDSPFENVWLADSASNATGNDKGNVLRGNSGANVLLGEGGADSLIGLAGNDTLNGGSGPDFLSGGEGDDVYLFNDQANALTITLQYSIDGPRSLVDAPQSKFTVTLFDLSGDSLIDTVQIFYYDTSQLPNGVYTALAYFSTSDLGVPLQEGTYTAGHGYLYEVPGDASLSVTFNGSTLGTYLGTFTINSINIDYGGTSPTLLSLDATYYQDGIPFDDFGIVRVWSGDPMASDTVSEEEDEGRDRVETPFSYALGENVEDLKLTGTQAVSGTGNGVNNLLLGNAAANTLSGAAGNDTLVSGGGSDNYAGGAGDDVFVIDATDRLVATVTDFTQGEDLIGLGAGYGALFDDGELIAGVLLNGAVATDAAQRLLYDGSTGNLYYDADGSDAGAAVHVATIATGLTLTADDFTSYA